MAAAVTDLGSIHKCKQRHFGANYVEEGLLHDVDDSPIGSQDDSEDENYDSDDTETYLEDQKRQDIRGKLLLLGRDAEYEPLALGL
jgi:hypothetical protein